MPDPTIYLATGNAGKVLDFRALAPALPLEPLPGFADLPLAVEDGTTFEENACRKAIHYSRLAPDRFVLADDSGLEVDALDGAPGVDSALYAGRHGDDAANNRLLLERLRGLPHERRRARFVCVLALSRSGQMVTTVRGEAEGTILDAPRGELGFGYDPLFYSPAAGRSFGELERAQKGRFSHRGAALRKLAAWLNAHTL